MIVDMRTDDRCQLAIDASMAVHGRLMASLVICANENRGFGHDRIKRQMRLAGLGCIPRSALKQLWQTVVSIIDGGYNPHPGNDIKLRLSKSGLFMPTDGFHRIALLKILDKPIPATIGE